MPSLRTTSTGLWEKRKSGRIFFQGGVAYNQGVVNAFRALLGKDIHVPPFFSVTGAYGVALLAKEAMASGKTGFKGFDVEQKEIVIERQKGSEPKTGQRKGFNKQIEELIFAGYDGSRDDKKKTVGIPRALFTYGTFPMFYTVFKELGFNVLLSDPTNEETIKLGQEYSLDETCYPVKLINGHVAELVRKNVDSIFFPDLYTVDHPGSQSSRASVDSGRKHTLTNEYLSVTALLGDVLKVLSGRKRHGDGAAFFIPQTEGAEIDGQANRFVRTKRDAEGYKNADIFAPFIEDALCKSGEHARTICLGLPAGDIIRFAHTCHRKKYLKKLRAYYATDSKTAAPSLFSI